MKPITLEEAKKLTIGQIVYHRHNENADGTPQRWKVNGQVKTWKRNPNRVKVPLKHGLYLFRYLTKDDLSLVSLTEGGE